MIKTILRNMISIDRGRGRRKGGREGREGGSEKRVADSNETALGEA